MPPELVVLLNGVPVNDAESQGTWFVNTPDLAAAVQDVQLQRGVGASTYGTGGLGASLNLRTIIAGREAGAYLSNSAGSWGTHKHTLVANSGRIHDRFAAQVRITQIGSDGWVDRASAKLSALQADLTYFSKKFKINLFYLRGQERTYQAWYGVPEDSLSTHRRLNLAGN